MMNTFYLRVLATAALVGCAVGCSAEAPQQVDGEIGRADEAQASRIREVSPDEPGPPPPAAVPGEAGGRTRGLQLGSVFSMSGLPQYGNTTHFLPDYYDAMNTPVKIGVIYAIRARTGTRVDGFTIRYYQPSNPDNRYRAGDPLLEYSAGGTGGGLNPWDACGGANVAIGANFYTDGNYLTGIGLVCANIDGTGYAFNTPTRGSLAGSNTSQFCATGYILGYVGTRSVDSSGSGALYVAAGRSWCISKT